MYYMECEVPISPNGGIGIFLIQKTSQTVL